MTTWLHDTDALLSLAGEDGPIREWSRIRLLGRGIHDRLPEQAQGRALAAWSVPPEELPGDPAAALQLYRCLGVQPARPGAWDAALTAALDGAQGPFAADLLLLLGGLRPEHAHLLARHEEAPSLGLWLVQVSPDAPATSRALEPWLRADLERGGERLLHACRLLLRLEPVEVPTDPMQAFQEGRRDGGALPIPRGRGSSRRQLANALLVVRDHLPDALAELLCAATSLHKAPPLPARVAWLVGWASAVDRQAALEVRLARGFDDPGTLRDLRQALEAGTAVPSPVNEAQRRVHALCDGHPLRPDDVRQVPLTLALQALAHPERVLAHLEQVETRAIGRAQAVFVPSEEVLGLLLRTDVPADPDEAALVGEALAAMATPATAPILRALLPHLRDDDAASARALYEGLLQQRL